MRQQAAERSFCSCSLNLVKLQITYCRSVQRALNVLASLFMGIMLPYCLFVRPECVLKFKALISCVSASIPT